MISFSTGVSPFTRAIESVTNRPLHARHVLENVSNVWPYNSFTIGELSLRFHHDSIEEIRHPRPH
jgi:hypothetical protein